MPCRISHTWHNEVDHGCRVHFLNMAECVTAELKESKLKPLEACTQPQIRVIGIDAILTARIYQKGQEGAAGKLPFITTMFNTQILSLTTTTAAIAWTADVTLGWIRRLIVENMLNKQAFLDKSGINQGRHSSYLSGLTYMVWWSQSQLQSTFP